MTLNPNVQVPMPEENVIVRAIGDYNPVYTKVRPI